MHVPCQTGMLGSRMVSALYGLVDFPHRENRFNLRTHGENSTRLRPNLIPHSRERSAEKCLKVVTYRLILSDRRCKCLLRQWALITQIHQG
jgi:hypothetical protein